MDKTGVIYILTNPSFPEYVKIGYADDIVDDKTVSYQGQSYSLSSLAQLLTGSKYSVAGPRYFKYKGEWLNDIRHRLEGSD